MADQLTLQSIMHFQCGTLLVVNLARDIMNLTF